MSEVKNKINKTYQVILFLAIPMTVGLSILAKPIWTIFYGESALGALTYQYLVFVALATAIFTATTTIIQLLKEYKVLFISLVSGIMIKVLLNVPFIYGFNKMGFPAFYGAITTTILGFLVPSIICMVLLKRKYKVNFESTVKEFINILISVIVMTLALLVLQIFIPINTGNRIVAVLITMLYSFVGILVYVGITFRTKTIYNIFGIESLRSFIKSLKRTSIKKKNNKVRKVNKNKK